ncbi:MAG: hypothetical protein F4Y49_03245 [Dehalococcoidia bacterium]|nr:hypothetical protein [Dehalococcoidia bacterium]
MCDELTPQQRLADIVAEETDGGRRVVRFFVQVAEGELDHQGFKPNHRMDAAKELIKVGLTEFDDYIRAGDATIARRAPRSRRPALDPEMEQARHELAQYARELTDGGRSVIRLYADVMDGLRNDDGFKPHHRIAAGRELLKRGFDYECAHATSTVVPTKAGTQQDPGYAIPEVRPEPATEDADTESNYAYTPEEHAQIQEFLDKIDKLAEEADPSEYEEESSDRQIDYSMWDIIDSHPEPEITEEHARIGAALFHEAVEKQRIWRESGVKIPTRKDHDNYDDG